MEKLKLNVYHKDGTRLLTKYMYSIPRKEDTIEISNELYKVKDVIWSLLYDVSVKVIIEEISD